MSLCLTVGLIDDVVTLFGCCLRLVPCWLLHMLLQRDPAAFTEYLHTYRNTICGRHPISVLLQVTTHSPLHVECWGPDSSLRLLMLSLSFVRGHDGSLQFQTLGMAGQLRNSSATVGQR